MDEQELALKCAQNDRYARQELYVKYSSRLFAMCLRYEQNHTLAEDILQDAFIHIFDKIGRFQWEGPGSLYSWMVRLTLNQIFDNKRLRKRLSLYELDSVPKDYLLVDEPEYKEASSLPPKVLAEMIAQLPNRYRTVFQLYCIESQPHKAIANLLGIKETTSASDLSRAKVLLIKAIKQYQDENGLI